LEPISGKQKLQRQGRFHHKLKIAAKEADQTEYWLLLCSKSEGITDCSALISYCVFMIKVLSKIIGAMKRNFN
jgi:four helix bundle protein